MRAPGEIFQRLMKKVRRETRLPVIGIALVPAPQGTSAAVAYAIEGATVEDIDRAAEALLFLITRSGEATKAAGETICPCCVERIARVEAALKILGARPAEPGPRLH